MAGGIEVGKGHHLCLAGEVSPYTQSSSSRGRLPSPSSQSSTKTLIPTPSSGSRRTSTPCVACVWSCSFRSALMRSSARGAAFGGSSLIGSQPTGGEPGGEIRKFFSSSGGRRKLLREELGEDGSIGVGSARYTRSVVSGLVQDENPRMFVE